MTCHWVALTVKSHQNMCFFCRNEDVLCRAWAVPLFHLSIPERDDTVTLSQHEPDQTTESQAVNETHTLFGVRKLKSYFLVLTNPVLKVIWFKSESIKPDSCPTPGHTYGPAVLPLTLLGDGRGRPCVIHLHPSPSAPAPVYSSQLLHCPLMATWLGGDLHNHSSSDRADVKHILRSQALCSCAETP